MPFRVVSLYPLGQRHYECTDPSLHRLLCSNQHRNRPTSVYEKAKFNMIGRAMLPRLLPNFITYWVEYVGCHAIPGQSTCLSAFLLKVSYPRASEGPQVKRPAEKVMVIRLG